MTIKQSRYILAETEREKKVRVTEVQRAEEDPFIRRSEVQQRVNNSTLPVSSRAVNLALSSYASITYVDDKFNSIDLSKYLTIENANQTYSTKAEVAGKWDVQETVGSGKLMKEGAHGLARSVRAVADVLDADQYSTGLSSRTVVGLENRPSGANGNIIVLGSGGNYGSIIYTGLNQELYINTNANGFRGWVRFYSDKNTTTDKSGVLHLGTKKPIDTLNVSDMGDTVVDNDSITVTSGAVYRAIGQLMDQIANLEARVEELENGGV